MQEPETRDMTLIRRRPRKTFGLLIDWVAMPFHSAIMNAVEEVFQARDINLVCLITGQLGSHRVTEQCRNVLAEFASSDVLDGLLVSASTLESYAGHHHLSELLSRYGDLALVTLHDRFDGIPAVAADNAGGTALLLDHLIEGHGYRRIAFVRGKKGRHDFDERWEQWRTSLKNHGIAYRDDLVYEGDYGPESGIAAVRYFLPRRGEFDVIVLANDAMALGAKQELLRQGVDDLPLVGFDDSEQASQLGLTTVRQSLFDQVTIAVDLLVSLTEGRSVAAESRESSRLVVRESCGCSAAVGSPPPGGQLVPRRGIDYSPPLSESDLDGLYDLGETMFSTLDQKEEIRRAVYQFRAFGVESCCISLYDDKNDPLATSRLTMAYDGDRDFHLDGSGLQFPTRSLVPPGILDQSRRRSLLVQALFCGPEQIGFAVFGLRTRKWRICEMLRRELSLALKGSSLVRQALSQTGELERRVRTRTQELEAANAELKLQYDEKSRIESELTRREARYRELIMKTPALVLELDLLFRPLFINQAGLEMLGLENLDGRRGVSFLKYVHPDDGEALEESLRTALERSEATSGEFRLLSTTGKVANLVFEASGLTKDGSPRSLRLSGINVTTLFSNVTRPEEILFEHYKFSPRVREVLELMLRGSSTKDIAGLLEISENTVKTHIRSIYAEVGVVNRSGLFKILREYQVHHFGHQSYVVSMLSTLVQE